MQVSQLMFSQLQSTLYLHQEIVTCATQPNLMSDYIQYKDELMLILFCIHP